MKKLIFFSKNLKIGGLEKSLVALLNNIDFTNYSVTLVLEKKEGNLLKSINQNVKVIDYNLSNNSNILIRKSINLFKKIKFLVKNYRKYDCSINYTTYSVWGSQMALKCSKNSVLYMHTDYYGVYDGKINEIKNFLKTIYFEKFNKIVFVSKHAEDGIKKIFPEMLNKFILLGNLVDYDTIIKKSQEYKAKVDAQKINFLVVSRLDESSKKLSKLIEAVNNNDNNDKFNLYIIGSGPDENAYRKLSKSNSIIFLGEMENPYPYIKECDYLVLTSKYEGFPVVYNEATVLGTSIITTIPVEDEQIIYNSKNIIVMDSKLLSFDDIIKNIVEKRIIVKKTKMDFNKINNDKIKRFYEIISR